MNRTMRHYDENIIQLIQLYLVGDLSDGEKVKPVSYTHLDMERGMEQKVMMEALDSLGEILGMKEVGNVDWNYDSRLDCVVDILGRRFSCLIKNIVTTSNFGTLREQLKFQGAYPIILVARYIYPLSLIHI